MTPEATEYVEKITGWLVDWDRGDPTLAVEVRAKSALDGVYRGESRRIRRLVMLAYLRGVREGAYRAWEAKQPVGPCRGVA